MTIDYNLPTVYNGSAICPKCKGMMDPKSKAFAGRTGLCANCRNDAFKKNAKAAMGPGNR